MPKDSEDVRLSGVDRKPVGWVELLRNPSRCGDNRRVIHHFAKLTRRVSRSLSSGRPRPGPVAPPILRTDLPDEARRANQFDRFTPIHLARPALDGAKSPAPKSQFHERNQSDGAVQFCRQIFFFPITRNCGTFRASRPDKRGVAQRHQRGAGCGGRFGDARRALPEAYGEIVWS
jgi:hypothetical protein